MNTKAPLLAFHNDPAIKDKYMARVLKHKELDQIVHLTYGESGLTSGEYFDPDKFKGCSVGCTLHSGNHYAAEDEIGIPGHLMILNDSVFEGLNPPHDTEWPLRFLRAAPVGADLSLVLPQFVYWALMEGDGALVKLFDVADKAEISAEDREIFAKGKAAFIEIANTYRHWSETGIKPDLSNLALDLDLARALDLDLDRALDLDLDRALALALDLALDLDLARALDRAWEEIGDKLVELMSSAPVPVMA